MARTRRMKPAIKQLWVNALRSGDYRQGRGELKTKRGAYCCLGVLCDLYRQKVGDLRWTEDRYFGSMMGSLPRKVSRWAGLGDRSDPIIDPTRQDGRGSAANCNDTLHWSFKKIATAIDEHL